MVDLDLSLCPDVFGLKAFDEKMLITRMLLGSSPCELRLLLPDNNIRKDGFHDVVVENLIGSSTWRSRHVSPSDVIALRRRWPRAMLQVMKKRCIELEDLRRQAFTGLQWAYRYAFLGYCPECKTRTEGSLDVDSDHWVSSSLDPSGISGMDITSAPLIAVPIPVESRAVRIYLSCVIHLLYIHKMDSGPVRMMTIAHAFNYRVAVLRDGVRSAVRVGRSRKALKRVF